MVFGDDAARFDRGARIARIIHRHRDAVRGALGELRLLLKLAVELGDLPAAGRDAVAAALERVGGGAPAA